MTEDVMEPWPAYYWGRLWDAPLTDGARKIEEGFADAMFNGEVVTNCLFCEERLGIEDDILLTPGASAHLECHIRQGIGDVQHLEGRCLCSRGSGNEITHDSDRHDSKREEAKAALQWLVDNHRGRWHD